MPKIQQIVRKDKTTIFTVNISKDAAEQVGLYKGQEVQFVVNQDNTLTLIPIRGEKQIPNK